MLCLLASASPGLRPTISATLLRLEPPVMRLEDRLGPRGASPSVSRPIGGDRYSGGAVPFSALGTAGISTGVPTDETRVRSKRRVDVADQTETAAVPTAQAAAVPMPQEPAVPMPQEPAVSMAQEPAVPTAPTAPTAAVPTAQVPAGIETAQTPTQIPTGVRFTTRGAAPAGIRPIGGDRYSGGAVPFSSLGAADGSGSSFAQSDGTDAIATAQAPARRAASDAAQSISTKSESQALAEEKAAAREEAREEAAAARAAAAAAAAEKPAPAPDEGWKAAAQPEGLRFTTRGAAPGGARPCVGDRYSGGCVPFASLGTSAGGGSSFAQSDGTDTTIVTARRSHARVTSSTAVSAAMPEARSQDDIDTPPDAPTVTASQASQADQAAPPKIPRSTAVAEGDRVNTRGAAPGGSRLVVGDRYCGAAAPFAPLGTAIGGGSSANQASAPARGQERQNARLRAIESYNARYKNV